jgi:hypothetical protein
MIERRKSTRTEAQVLCSLLIEGREIEAQLENLADDGALFALRNTALGEGPSFFLGRDASFVLKSFTPARKYTGEIIRLFFRDGSPRIALRFWQKYTTLAQT